MTHDRSAAWVRAGSADRQALVAIHTWVEEAKHYEALVASMGDHQVLSILPPTVDGPMPRRVEQWVDYHESVLATLPVEPPYRFLGWSFGGVVALELARRLRDAGGGSSFVGLIDTIRPRLLPLSTREYVWYHLSSAAAIDDERARSLYLRDKGLYLVYRRFPKSRLAGRRVLERLGKRDPLAPPKARPTDPLTVSIHASYLNYRGTGVPFPVSIYATESSVRRAREPALRWAPWLHAGYEFSRIPGGHFTLFDDRNIGVLADAVKVSLARYDAGGR